MWFADRVDAGRRLAESLRFLAGADLVVVGLPHGGVPVAFEVARGLGAPLDVILVRKLGVPVQPELAMGAVGECGIRIVDDEIVRSHGVRKSELAKIEQRELAEIERCASSFRRDKAPVPLTGRTVVVVDDGIATGATARAGCRVVRAQGAARVVLAVPVGPSGVHETMRRDADEIVCLYTPANFRTVGRAYADFAQTSDAEVAGLLHRAADLEAAMSPTGIPVRADPARDDEVSVHAGAVQLAGHLTVPEDAHGLVVFAHGSGSSRNSPRNLHVAAQLNAAGLGTLLFDLLTPAEEAGRAHVFDIKLLAHRLVEVTDWLRTQPDLAEMRIGYFGASTGAAAALAAAADPRTSVSAVVSRGGRPDFAGRALGRVQAPTLLIVGSHDRVVLDLNRAAQRRLHCENRLAVVPGATHLFEEPGTLEQVARLAAAWFINYLTPAADLVVARP